MKLPVGRFHGAIVKLRRAKVLSHRATVLALVSAETGRRGYRALHQFIERCQVLGDRLSDLLSGAETARTVDFNALRAAPSIGADGYSYIPSKSASFRALMKRTGIDCREYAFFDFGAGKGRVLLMASRLPFQKITGIEYSPDLVAIAEQNLSAQLKGRDDRVQIIHADAAAFDLPAVNSIYYFYNPFGRETMRNVIHNIEAALARGGFKCLVTYLRPDHADFFTESGLFEEIASGVIGNEHFKIFRSR